MNRTELNTPQKAADQHTNLCCMHGHLDRGAELVSFPQPKPNDERSG